jgi:hypothetical protein
MFGIMAAKHEVVGINICPLGFSLALVQPLLSTLLWEWECLFCAIVSGKDINYFQFFSDSQLSIT